MTDLRYLTVNRSDRFDLSDSHPTMKAVVTRGAGDFDMLDYCDVPMPELNPGELLLKVLAAGVNNTEINTRLGWYSAAVTDATETLADSGERGRLDDGGWNGSTPFPFIQGTDCCGEVVAVADELDNSWIGKRVLVRACMRLNGFDSLECIWMASNFDGAFAQYVALPASEVFVVDSDWSHAELATIPCAYGTAENMVHRADVEAGDRVLVTGASGGVGSAALQLLKRRGADVTAVVGKSKISALSVLAVDRIIERDTDLIAVLGESSFDVVIDNVAGPGFAPLLKLLCRGGRYVSSGAIAGPMVDLDMRDFYLKDLSLIGCTAWEQPVFPNLIGYIERKEIIPLLAKTFALAEIIDAQQAFIEKNHFGNFVLIPPQ